jgi:hypothetical protein
MYLFKRYYFKLKGRYTYIVKVLKMYYKKLLTHLKVLSFIKSWKKITIIVNKDYEHY